MHQDIIIAESPPTNRVERPKAFAYHKPSSNTKISTLIANQHPLAWRKLLILYQSDL